MKQCPTCKGTGKSGPSCVACSGQGKLKCATCSGAGKVGRFLGLFGGQPCVACERKGTLLCAKCDGSGAAPPCSFCGGKGTLDPPREFRGDTLAFKDWFWAVCFARWNEDHERLLAAMVARCTSCNADWSPRIPMLATALGRAPQCGCGGTSVHGTEPNRGKPDEARETLAATGNASGGAPIATFDPAKHISERKSKGRLCLSVGDYTEFVQRLREAPLLNESELPAKAVGKAPRSFQEMIQFVEHDLGQSAYQGGTIKVELRGSAVYFGDGRMAEFLVARLADDSYLVWYP